MVNDEAGTISRPCHRRLPSELAVALRRRQHVQRLLVPLFAHEVHRNLHRVRQAAGRALRQLVHILAGALHLLLGIRLEVAEGDGEFGGGFGGEAGFEEQARGAIVQFRPVEALDGVAGPRQQLVQLPGVLAVGAVALVKRRNLKLKAKFESVPSYSSFKR